MLDGIEGVGDVLDAGDDGLGLVALLLLLLALSVVLGGIYIYLVWCAPTILTEAVFHVLM